MWAATAAAVAYAKDIPGLPPGIAAVLEDGCGAA
jgi:hypothetical protein